MVDHFVELNKMVRQICQTSQELKLLYYSLHQLICPRLEGFYLSADALGFIDLPQVACGMRGLQSTRSGTKKPERVSCHRHVMESMTGFKLAGDLAKTPKLTERRMS